MRMALLAVCSTLLIFAAANAVASVLMMLHWRSRRAAWMRRSASSLLFYRCLPAAFSAALAWLTVLPSFILHESRDQVEAVSLPLAIGAAAGLAILAAAAVRGVVAIRRTRLSLRRWLLSARSTVVPGWSGPAWLVEPDSAGVCVVGFRHPVLLVARRVVETCTSGELTGVAAHETAHAATGDNWKRLILRGMPDVVGMTPIAGQLERVWRARAEEEADAAAVSTHGANGVEIAGALVKLARWHVGPGLPLATSIDAGGSLERRVRKVLEDVSPVPDARRSRWTVLGLAVGVSILLGTLPPFSRSVHLVVEALVQALV
ncbi:MAG: hypothetical protein ACREAA_18280 [Candidatus Polarisedimenticolia bacterium]